MNNFLLKISMLLDQQTRLQATSAKVNEILKNIVGPCLSVIGSLGILYIIILGVQYAKSESDEKRAECKKRMVNLAIGVIVMIIMLTLCFAIKWDKIVPELFGYYPNVPTN